MAKKVVLFIEYQIGAYSGNTGNWEFNTYTADSLDSRFRVSQGFGLFPISEWVSPEIYTVQFPTQSFSKRTCTTRQLCMLYGYLLPSTSFADHPLDYMTYTIPSEFGYSSITTYDGCSMQESNNDYNPVACTAARDNSEVTITFIPDNYNHNYKLVAIDNADQSQLFLSPAYPGSQYQVKANLFDSAGILYESMMVNLTTVYGLSLTHSLM